MKWMSVNEVRERFLKFFESKNHLRMRSASLVPINDDSLLLINSGMAPLKKYFTGEVTPPSKRATNCQKCIRTNDIENVGKTDRHGSFFEMLGNFSFGDYFKKEAIEWGWEFSTKVMNIPEEKIWISVYQDDDEAYDIWTKKIGVPKERVVRLGKEDNFWEHGAGPCGPSSELHFDRGKEHGCDKLDCSVGCDCDRYLEYWNLVFTQFENDGNGNYTPLKKPNIDTGMGLERIAAMMQNVDTIFDLDTNQEIIEQVSKIANVKYHQSKEVDVALRVIADHVKSTVFLISDGVMPSNEGRGYVLRRLMRRALRYGKLLNIKGDFLNRLCKTVIKNHEGAYLELSDKEEYIVKVVVAEEERFGKTINQGIELIYGIISNMHKKENIFSGEDAFKLYDTFGFPIDLTKEILEEKNIGFDEKTFLKLMDKQRNRAREAREEKGGSSWHGDLTIPETEKTKFVGYTDFTSKAKILYIVKNDSLVDKVAGEDECIIILDETPFYAESGGQVADTGFIKTNNGIFKVSNCQKNVSGIYMHYGKVESGYIKKDEEAFAEIDVEKRKAIMRNHTSAHMLQAALRKVLGEHIHQAGSYVDETKMRFDFSHYEAVTDEDIHLIEHMVNEEILNALKVKTEVLSIEEAQKTGALTMPGEDYADMVRVLSIGNYSVEFCGGTHVDNSSKLGLFKILSESSIAAGVRRIEATTGFGVLKLYEATEKLLLRSAGALKLKAYSDIVDKIKSVVEEGKEKDNKIIELNNEIAKGLISNLLENAKNINGIKFINIALKNYDTEILRAAVIRMTENNPSVVIVVSNTGDNKSFIISSAGKEAIKNGIHAGNLVKEVANVTGGSGGGKPNFAMAGVKDVSLVDTAIEKSIEIFENMLK